VLVDHQVVLLLMALDFALQRRRRSVDSAGFAVDCSPVDVKIF
jgi:hypothetical protein